MRLVKNILDHNLKIIFFVTHGLEWKLQEILFKISTKKSDDRMFWKNLENPNFGPFKLKYKYFCKIGLQ